MNDTVFYKYFLDICRGYSSSSYKNLPLYLKHFNLEDQIIIEDGYNEFLSLAESKGLPRRQVVIDRLIKNGYWSEEENNYIINLDNEIKNLQNSKKRQFLPSKIKEIDKKIESKRGEKFQKDNELNGLIQSCAEFHAQQKLNDIYIKIGFFKDSNLEQVAFDEAAFEYLENRNIESLTELYQKIINVYSEDLIKKIAIKDFCLNYFCLSDNVKDVFGRDIYKLTFFQLKLANYARYFKNIFETNETDKIPTEIRSDPDKLIDYINTNKNAEEIMNKTARDDSGNKETLFNATSFVGAKKEDIDMMKGKQDESGPDIFELAKKNGGVLSLQDLMRLKNR